MMRREALGPGFQLMRTSFSQLHGLRGGSILGWYHSEGGADSGSLVIACQLPGSIQPCQVDSRSPEFLSKLRTCSIAGAEEEEPPVGRHVPRMLHGEGACGCFVFHSLPSLLPLIGCGSLPPMTTDSRSGGPDSRNRMPTITIYGKECSQPSKQRPDPLT
jgi:hypothetical protein